jgi:hypothetical protein
VVLDNGDYVGSIQTKDTFEFQLISQMSIIFHTHGAFVSKAMTAFQWGNSEEKKAVPTAPLSTWTTHFYPV